MRTRQFKITVNKRCEMDSQKFVRLFSFITLVISSHSGIYSEEIGPAMNERGDNTSEKVLLSDDYIEPDSGVFDADNRDSGNVPASKISISHILGKFSQRTKSVTIQHASNRIVVTTTVDSGEGSLRNAIISANNHTGPDSITFNLQRTDRGFNSSTNTWLVQPMSELPAIKDGGTIIDGTTQPGYSDKPVIELNGSLVDSANGFSIESSNNVIKGFVINGFKEGVYDIWKGNYYLGNGIRIQGEQNIIMANYIGVDYKGSLAVENETNGIKISGGNNTIANNLISGNGDDGIHIDTGENNVISGNLIGTDATGNSAIANDRGIYAYGRKTTIGGLPAESRNILSGNSVSGIYVSSWYNNIIGNYIGTDISGHFAIPNKYDGIACGTYSSYNLIKKNLISGNGRNGISHGAFSGIVSGTTSHCQIFGNFIGTDATGTIMIGNDHYGIEFGFNTIDNIVGGVNEEKRNIISGNGKDGIKINAGRRHKIIGNYIGTDISGEKDFGNAGCGIRIEWDAVGGVSTEGYYSEVGGSNLNEGNIICFNGKHGVQIYRDALQNLISHNAISQNQEQGIDNYWGGNLELQSPSILSPDTTVEFKPTVHGTSLPQVTIELYSDPHTPYDEGFIFFGSTVSDLNGKWQVKMNSPLERGDNYLTATAIDGNNNTSEFSAPFIVVTPAPNISLVDTSIIFSDVEVGLESVQHFIISNIGKEGLVVDAMNLIGIDPDQFRIESNKMPFTVEPGEEQEISVIFNPVSEGMKSATLQIISNDPDESIFGLSLTGTVVILEADISVNHLSHDFGNIIIGDSSNVTVTIYNTGDDTLEITNIASSDPKQFIPSKSVLYISPLDSQVMAIVFKPKSAGPQGAEISIESNDPDQPLLGLELHGTGMTSQPSAPLLHHIENADGDHRYTVRWDSVFADTIRYWLAIDTDDQFSTSRVAYIGESTSYGIAFQRKGTYFYRVMANNKMGVSEWSNAESVTVSEDPPHYMTSSSGVYGENGPANFRTESITFWDDWLGWTTYRGVTITWDSTGNEYKGGMYSWQMAVEPYGIVSFYRAWLTGGFFGDEYAQYFYSSIPSPTFVDEKSNVLPVHLELLQNYPNPFNPLTTIEYCLPEPEYVHLLIYDVLGRQVKNLVDMNQPAGNYRTTWNGTDDHGLPVVAGIYFCRLEAGDSVKRIKLLLVK